jgi:hypothetical protein
LPVAQADPAARPGHFKLLIPKRIRPVDELSALYDFRFKERMPSRAAAVRELLRRGLAAVGFDPAASGTKSSEFGVIKITPGDRSR